MERETSGQSSCCCLISNLRLELIAGSLDVVANFDVWTSASPFRSG